MRGGPHDPREKYRTCDLGEAHRTELGYLTSIARNYFEEFKFFWVRASCNKELKEMIEEHKVSLFVYSPTKQQYTTLKTKLTKSNMEKFLKLVHRDQVQLRHVPNPKQQVNACLQDEL